MLKTHNKVVFIICSYAQQTKGITHTKNRAQTLESTLKTHGKVCFTVCPYDQQKKKKGVMYKESCKHTPINTENSQQFFFTVFVPMLSKQKVSHTGNHAQTLQSLLRTDRKVFSLFVPMLRKQNEKVSRTKHHTQPLPSTLKTHREIFS